MERHGRLEGDGVIELTSAAGVQNPLEMPFSNFEKKDLRCLYVVLATPQRDPFRFDDSWIEQQVIERIGDGVEPLLALPSAFCCES